MKLEESIEQILCGVNSNNTGLQIEELLKLFEEEKRKAVTDMAKSAIEESDKSIVGLAEDLRRIFLSDLTELEHNIGMLRQWLNEDRICDINRMVTNEQIGSWLKLQEIKAKYQKE